MPDDSLITRRLSPVLVGGCYEAKVRLSRKQAAAGCELVVDIPSLTGRIRLKVRVPADTVAGRKVRLRGQGLPNDKGDPRDLFLVLLVRNPAFFAKVALGVGLGVLGLALLGVSLRSAFNNSDVEKGTRNEGGAIGSIVEEIESGVQSEEISVPFDAKTLQLALDMAKEGQTIRLAEGDHFANVFIERSVRIIGSSHGTRLHSSRGSAQPVISVEKAVSVELRDLEIMGLESTAFGMWNQSILALDSSNERVRVSLFNCTLSKGKIGILAEGNSELELDNCTLTLFDSTAISAFGKGPVVDGNRSASPRVLLKSSRIGNCPGAGVTVYFGAEVVAEACTFQDLNTLGFEKPGRSRTALWVGIDGVLEVKESQFIGSSGERLDGLVYAAEERSRVKLENNTVSPEGLVEVLYGLGRDSRGL